MARRRLFNRNQPRDRNGRWTSGGSSLGASRGANRRANRKTLTGVQLKAKSAKLRRFQNATAAVQLGAAIGTAIQPGPGTLVGAAVGGAADFAHARVQKKRRAKRRR